MPRYRIVSEEDFQELCRLVELATELIAQAGELNLPDSAISAAAPSRDASPSPNGRGQDAENEAHVGEAAKYRISRGEWGYVDVVDREVEADEFSLDEVCDIVLPLIETDNKRPRDTLRNALDRDDGYERMERNGVWWRRLGTGTADDEEASTGEGEARHPEAKEQLRPFGGGNT